MVSTPAVLLRSFAYGETSRVLRFYSEELGVVGVMGRGVRKAGARGGQPLETFSQGILTAWVKPGRELQTLKDFAPSRPHRGLAHPVLRFAGASLIGELVLKHAEAEANPVLFGRLSGGLDRLESAGEERLVPAILSEAWGMVADLGYAPELKRCVSCGRSLSAEETGRFDFAAGGVRCSGCGEAASGPRVGPGAREQLLAFVRGGASEATSPRAHVQLLHDFVLHHVTGGTPLRTAPFLLGLVP